MIIEILIAVFGRLLMAMRSVSKNFLNWLCSVHIREMTVVVVSPERSIRL